IRRAVEEAEGVSGIPVESALIGVAGSHVRGLNSRGGVTLGNRPRDIEREDVRRAIDAARNVSLPEDREVLHVLPHEFSVDAHDGIRDAIGMVGQRLEANVHVVTSSMIATQNLVTAANRAGILISDTVVEPLASAEACLTQDERDLGTCLLDIGGGTTELVVSGGGARLNGLIEMMEQALHLPVRIGEPRGLVDMPEQVEQPEYATVVGLVLYGAKARRTQSQRSTNFVAKLRSMFAGA